jgi:hypothetical protein
MSKRPRTEEETASSCAVGKVDQGDSGVVRTLQWLSSFLASAADFVIAAAFERVSAADLLALRSKVLDHGLPRAEWFASDDASLQLARRGDCASKVKTCYSQFSAVKARVAFALNDLNQLAEHEDKGEPEDKTAARKRLLRGDPREQVVTLAASAGDCIWEVADCMECTCYAVLLGRQPATFCGSEHAKVVDIVKRVTATELLLCVQGPKRVRDAHPPPARPISGYIQVLADGVELATCMQAYVGSKATQPDVDVWFKKHAEIACAVARLCEEGCAHPITACSGLPHDASATSSDDMEDALDKLNGRIDSLLTWHDETSNPYDPEEALDDKRVRALSVIGDVVEALSGLHDAVQAAFAVEVGDHCMAAPMKLVAQHAWMLVWTFRISDLLEATLS